MVTLTLRDKESKKLCNHVTTILKNVENKGFTRGYISYGRDVTTCNHVTTFHHFSFEKVVKYG